MQYIVWVETVIAGKPAAVQRAAVSLTFERVDHMPPEVRRVVVPMEV